jgi:hypothetical protein
MDIFWSIENVACTTGRETSRDDSIKQGIPFDFQLFFLSLAVWTLKRVIEDFVS